MILFATVLLSVLTLATGASSSNSTDCDEGFYYSNYSNRCLECRAYCQRCDSNRQCLRCEQGYSPVGVDTICEKDSNIRTAAILSAISSLVYCVIVAIFTYYCFCKKIRNKIEQQQIINDVASRLEVRSQRPNRFTVMGGFLPPINQRRRRRQNTVRNSESRSRRRVNSEVAGRNLEGERAGSLRRTARNQTTNVPPPPPIVEITLRPLIGERPIQNPGTS